MIVKKFEYKAINFSELTRQRFQELDINKLNELGEKGWELVNVVNGQCIFKREVVAQNENKVKEGGN